MTFFGFFVRQNHTDLKGINTIPIANTKGHTGELKCAQKAMGINGSKCTLLTGPYFLILNIYVIGCNIHVVLKRMNVCKAFGLGQGGGYNTLA